MDAWSAKKILSLKYDTTAEGYDSLYGEEQLEKYVVALSHLHSLRAKLLCDIGAGTLLFKDFLEKTQHYENIGYYLGLDLSEGMLSQALARRDARVDLVQADAEYLPLRDKACEITVSFTVIDLLPSPQRFIAECRRATRYTCIISSLKKAQRLNTRALRLGKHIGETGKDIIFEVRISTLSSSQRV